MGWTMRRDGADLEIVPGEDTRTAHLLVDGVEADVQTADYWESSTLRHGDTEIEVRWGPRNTIVACALLTRDGDDVAKRPLAPPPGSRAAKREAFQREHPTLYVVRRVGQAALEIVIGVLGVGAIVSAFFGSLLPRLDLSWLPDAPGWVQDLSAPDWLRDVDPLHWLGELGLTWPDIDLPGWLDPVLDTKKYWLPLVIAVFIALGELERRRKVDADRSGREDEQG